MELSDEKDMEFPEGKILKNNPSMTKITLDGVFKDMDKVKKEETCNCTDGSYGTSSKERYEKSIVVPQKMLVSFESGHYKTLKGKWKGDSVWMHWIKSNGKAVHINKDKVEYMEEL